MKPKKQWGGRRKGAGRKETGVNTVNVTFSVHKDHVDLIKAFVQSKRLELSKQPIKPVVVKDLNKPTNYVKPITAPPPKSNYSVKQPANDYLERRRNAKLSDKRT